MKAVRESGAKSCLKNVKNYVESVVYSDIYISSYDDKGNISLNFGQEKLTPKTVLVWGGISSHPTASLVRVTGKFDSSSYIKIIQQQVLPLKKKEPIGLIHDW